MPKVEVEINPKVIEWAIYNSDYDMDYLLQTIEHLDKWIKGEQKPTLVQLGKFSNKIHIPFGYLLSKTPPEGALFSADCRTIKDQLIRKPSRALAETINDMEAKKLWMRDYRIFQGSEKIDFIGTFKNRKDKTDLIIEKIRKLLNLETDWALHEDSLDKAYNLLKERIENVGVLVMKDALVLGNTSRKLDIKEFRAFVLYDDYAPLIFLNGQDSKAARIFSLLHEFCHLLISDDDDILIDSKETAENCCNKVAAEFLMPEKLVLELWKGKDDVITEINTLANKLKVSSLALARLLKSLWKIGDETYEEIYETSISNFEKSKNKTISGNPYATKRSNLSTEFVKAVLVSTGEGRTLFGDAYKLLNVSNSKTFNKLTEGY